MLELSELLAIDAAALAAAMLLLWWWSLILRDASIVDVFWGLGFVMVAWIGLIASEGGASVHGRLLAILVTAWGLRLSHHLFWRNRGKGEDPRYTAMRERHGERFGRVSLWSVFGLQGTLIWIISLPIQMAMGMPEEPDCCCTPIGLGWVGISGACLCSLGIVIESLADRQLARFRAGSSPGQILDRGLWSWTRHPNYFGDFLVWWGIFLVACETPWGWVAFPSPLIMGFLLMKISGVPLLERSLRVSKPGWQAYTERTSAFFPRPPRR